MAYVNTKNFEVYSEIPDILLNVEENDWIYTDDIMAEAVVQLLQKGYPVANAMGRLYDMLCTNHFDKERELCAFMDVGCKCEHYIHPYSIIISEKSDNNKCYSLVSVYKATRIDICMRGDVNIDDYFRDESSFEISHENVDEEDNEVPSGDYTLISAAFDGEDWAGKLQKIIKLTSELLRIIQDMPSYNELT